VLGITLAVGALGPTARLPSNLPAAERRQKDRAKTHNGRRRGQILRNQVASERLCLHSALELSVLAGGRWLQCPSFSPAGADSVELTAARH